LVEVLLCIEEAMWPAASCLPRDICCRRYHALDGVVVSVAVVAGFAVVAIVVAVKVPALRALALLNGGLL
jgi:hypothetical protein